ncbi:MAG: signal recognition particle protein [Gammaproteobacteria bacterium]|nr:signal recognition particle protein [Gammaproteobacteria bacterium]
MFTSLTDRLSETVRDLSGRGRLTEKNMKSALDEVNRALLDADVALPVAKKFIMNVKQKAIGQKVLKSLSPGQELVKLVKKELTLLMGQANETLDLKSVPPVVVLMAGLQGSGKTTTTAKLGKFLKVRENKKVMVVSADVYRPAAIEQLEALAEANELNFYPSTTNDKPSEIAKSAYNAAKQQGMDVLIVDTAGRLHIDNNMMTEIKELAALLKPTEILFIVDSMTGQDAANTAKAFNDALALTGVILTKADGDARGGAALSIREITGKPIKFLGVGEKTEALQPFHPDRVASRILGMGDVLSLIEEAEQKMDRAKAEKFAKKLDKGSFDLEDFREQIKQMGNMGGMSNILDKMPGMGQLPASAKAAINDDMFKGIDAIISSMTKQERRQPEIIKASRKKRIASGSGTSIQEVNKLLKQFDQMQTMMKKFSKKGGLASLMKMMKGKMPGIPGSGGFGMPA